MTVSDREELAATPVTVTKVRGRREALYFARRNRKLLLGLTVVLAFWPWPWSARC